MNSKEVISKVSSKNLSQDLRTAIKKATLEAHNSGTIGGYGGEMERYISVDDKDYDLLREVDKLIRSSE